MKTRNSLKFLVIGCGSIGQRHVRNLLMLGYKNIEIFDIDILLSKKVAKEFKVIQLESLNFENIDCTMICTPPNTHIEIAKNTLSKKSHVFIEKPLSSSLYGIQALSKLATKYTRNVFVGYVFRFDIGLQKVRELLQQNTIGKILSVDAYEGWYLPKWRPWQDYTKSYTALEKLGGGIILDGSHELDYVQWLCGNVNQVFSYYRRIPDLKVKTEGLAEVLLTFKSGAIGRIHLDFVNPKYNRHCEIIGSKGSIRWSFETKTIEVQQIKKSSFKVIKYDKDTNKMYLNEIKYIIECINGRKNDLITLESAKKTLLVSLAIKKSGLLNRPISI